jgi:hypothetical protein
MTRPPTGCADAVADCRGGEGESCLLALFRGGDKSPSSSAGVELRRGGERDGESCRFLFLGGLRSAPVSCLMAGLRLGGLRSSFWGASRRWRRGGLKSSFESFLLDLLGGDKSPSPAEDSGRRLGGDKSLSESCLCRLGGLRLVSALDDLRGGERSPVSSWRGELGPPTSTQVPYSFGSKERFLRRSSASLRAISSSRRPSISTTGISSTAATGG